MEKKPSGEGVARFKRLQAVLRSWDGPNSRIGFELDLEKMPWGPFDALGKRVSLLLPSASEGPKEAEPSESEMERALRHVEHAADRCADFANLGNGKEDVWQQSLETWEWLRDHLTGEWLRNEVESEEGEEAGGGGETHAMAPAQPALPVMPGAAATLEVVGRALRAIPLSRWEEAVGELDPDAPTREEAVQTLLGVARLMSGPRGGQAPDALDPSLPEAAPVQPDSDFESDPVPLPEVESAGDGTPDATPEVPSGPAPEPETEPASGEVSFDYAQGFDEGYQIGRRVGRALGARLRLPSPE
ncbi:hypothetical protein ACFL3S_09050 [Gemmatimonadota bacterium]